MNVLTKITEHVYWMPPGPPTLPLMRWYVLCIALALGDISPSLISRALHEHLQPAAEPAPVRRTPVLRQNTGRSDMTVEGVGNLLMQLARCCQPDSLPSHSRGMRLS